MPGDGRPAPVLSRQPDPAPFVRKCNMAGSPTRTLRRVEKIEQRAIELAYDVAAAAPASFLEPLDSKSVPFPRDPLRRAWISAVEAAMGANVELERLGDLLREKAGSSEPSPFARLGAAMAGAMAQGSEDGEQHNGEPTVLKLNDERGDDRESS